MILNCIAVDDEPLALGLVCAFVEQTPFLNLKGRFSSAVEALKMLHTEFVDLIFLDIQMPDLNGIELARVIETRTGQRKPRIVFTTAYNQFAIDGFKVDALDYLLKPFNYEEFLRSANKALVYADLLHKADESLVLTDESASADYMFLKVEYQLVRIDFNDILYIEGLKDYAKIWRRGLEKSTLSLITLKMLEEKLPSKRFMRIHRSYIVSLDKINSVTRGAVQIGGINIMVGDQYKEAFNLFIGS